MTIKANNYYWHNNYMLPYTLLQVYCGFSSNYRKRILICFHQIRTWQKISQKLYIVLYADYITLSIWSFSVVITIPEISSIFDKCSMLEQLQSRPNHTSKTNVYFNKFVANILCNNIGSKKKKSASTRTTDAQWGNLLHCTAKNQLPLPNF